MDFPVIGWILILAAAAVVVGMMWAVVREQHAHEEHYTPGTSDSTVTEPSFNPYGDTIRAESDAAQPDATSTTRQ